MPVQELSFLLVAREGPHTEPAEGSATAAAAAAVPAPPAAAPLLATTARYTRSLLRQTLQLMGVKPRQSDKAAQKAFLILQQRAALPASEGLSLAGRLRVAPGGHAGVELSRGEFDRLVMDCLAAFDPPPQRQQGQSPPAQPQQPRQGQSPPLAHAAAAAHAAASAATAAAASLEDFRIACALREQRASVAVLLCGTSGTGKSTLAALLAARLGISTVVSTDSIRHMLRRWVGAGALGRSAVCVRSAL